MRRIGTLQTLMIVLFVLGYSAVSAQSDYIVTIKRDTLYGKVRYFSGNGVKYAGSSSKYVQLTPETGKKSTHEMLQTIAFRINGETYHTIRFDQGYTFMKLIKPGYLSLYAYQIENQSTWDGRYFVKKDGALLDIPNLGFKKRVPVFLADCPEVVKDIESGVLKKTQLEEIVDRYNACVTLKTHPVIKKSPVHDTWTKLETDVKALPDFDKKNDALEMIQEVIGKLSKNQTVPSFLVSGLKDALKDQSTVKETLDLAIEKLK